MDERLRSPRLVRRLTWFGGLLFVAGAVTFTVVTLGNKSAAPAAPAKSAAGDAIAAEPVAAGPRKSVPLAREARMAAGQFILSTVTRDDLAKGWTLAHPELCGCTRKEWMTGNIPVQVYPGEALEDASFAIEESYEDEVMLQVALLPKDGAEVPSEIFWLGLKKVGEGTAGKWLVYYFQPRVTVPVPVPE